MDKIIPLSIPNFEGNEKVYVDKALEEGWVSTGGAYINQLEENIAEFLQVSSAAACQSGTAGIHLAMIEADVQPNDYVIVPTLTFIAAVNPVRYQFAEPIFMDCDDSLCLDPQKLRTFCEQECYIKDDKLIYKKTERVIKALVVVHIFGNMADMKTIMKIAQDYKLKVIEDATEALGTVYTTGKYKGKYAGTIGDFGAFSFNGNKIITTGGGGIIVASSSKALEHIKYLSTQAKDDTLYYVHNEIGYNYRMTNLQAALGVAQLEELPEFIRRKNQNFALYEKYLEDCEGISLLSFRNGIMSNKWFYSLVIEKKIIPKSLEYFIKKLKEKGILTRPIWGLIHEQLPYKKCITYQIEQALFYKEKILNIPCSTNITEEEIRYISENIKDLCKEARND